MAVKEDLDQHSATPQAPPEQREGYPVVQRGAVPLSPLVPAAASAFLDSVSDLHYLVRLSDGMGGMPPPPM